MDAIVTATAEPVIATVIVTLTIVIAMISVTTVIKP